MAAVFETKRKDLIEAIRQFQPAFDVQLGDDVIDRLAVYYALVQEHNEFLHLVAPCSTEEFAIRHILESLTLLEHLPHGAKFADVGAGAGLPSIPCLLVRVDLGALLIESKEKKTKFLERAIKKLGIDDRANVVTMQFQEVDPAGCQAITCRALDKFTEKLPRLIKWSMRRPMLLFGGPNLRDALRAEKLVFLEKLMAESEQRYLFVLNR